MAQRQVRAFTLVVWGWDEEAEVKLGRELTLKAPAAYRGAGFLRDAIDSGLS